MNQVRAIISIIDWGWPPVLIIARLLAMQAWDDPKFPPTFLPPGDRFLKASNYFEISICKLNMPIWKGFLQRFLLISYLPGSPMAETKERTPMICYI